MALKITKKKKPEPPPKPKRRVRIAGKVSPVKAEPKPETPKPKRRVQLAGKTPPAAAERKPEPPKPKRRVQLAARTPAAPAERPASPRRPSAARTSPARHPASSASGGGEWIKWVLLAAFVAVVVSALGVYVRHSSRPPSRSPSIPDHYRGGDVQDNITRSMGGKSMEAWCKENEKDNEMVQQRRARRKGRTGR